MLEFSWFICGILYFLLYCYLFNCFVCKKKFKLTKKIFFFSIIMSVIYCMMNSFNIIYIRPYLIHLYIFVAFMLIYKKSFFITLLGILFSLIISCVSEIIYGFIAVLILNFNINEFNSLWYGYIFTNLAIFTISIIVSKIPFIKKIFSNILSWYNKNQYKSLIISIILLIIMITFLLYNNFLKLLPSSFLLLTNMFCIGVFVFVIGFFKEKSNNNRIITEYDQLLDYVKTYEKVIETKSKNQHEYKNQLILIKGMVKNKKVISYIDELLKTETDDSNIELLRKLQYLPQGGLKGLIYYKVEQMINIGVDVYVDVSEEISKKKIINKLNKNLQDISKIIGVYIDNAIEAVKELKDKYIVIEIYLEDDEIIFSLSNNYNGNINFDKVDKEGYTTKGNGKGYGLPLVKDILNHNDNLSQERSLNGIYYVQKLKIKK